MLLARLRKATPEEQTVSAGVALWDAEEAPGGAGRTSRRSALRGQERGSQPGDRRVADGRSPDAREPTLVRACDDAFAIGHTPNGKLDSNSVNGSRCHTDASAAVDRLRSPLLRAASDEKLIALTRRGRDDAFEALIERYRARLLGFCQHMLRSREDAEDVLQEVYVAALRAMRADDRPIQAKPWLYKIARNRCLNHLRRPTTSASSRWTRSSSAAPARAPPRPSPAASACARSSATCTTCRRRSAPR